MTAINISLSAGDHGFTKGDRIIAKVGRGEWLCGVVQTAGAKLKLMFDDASTAVVGSEDFKDVKAIAPKTKKTKAVMDAASAKALVAAFKLASKPVKAVKVAKVEKIAKVVKATKPAPIKAAKTVKAKPAPTKEKKVVESTKNNNDAKVPTVPQVAKAFGMPDSMSSGSYYFWSQHVKKGEQLPDMMKKIEIELLSGKMGFKATTKPITSGVSEARYVNQFYEVSLTWYRYPSSTDFGINIRPKSTPYKHQPAARDMSSLDQTFPVTGYIINYGGTEYAVGGAQRGRSLYTVDLFNLITLRTAVWKIRLGQGRPGRFTYVRAATPAELASAVAGRENHEQAKDVRANQGRDQANALGVEIGDVVGVQYSNVWGLTPEIVIDINWKTGKLAIQRKGWAASRFQKRRFINIKHVKSIITKGGGRYNPDNPDYK